MARHQKLLFIILCAVSMGFISGQLLLFNGSAMNVLPWSILAFGAAFLAKTKRQAVKFSAVFSFVVSFSFLLFNNTGTTTIIQAVKLIVAASVASLFGLLGGMLLGWLGWKVRCGFKEKTGDR